MSFDARDHFADGFPFLLAPLAQVKGVSSSVPNQENTKSEGKSKKQNMAPFTNIGKLTDDAFKQIMASADGASSWVQGNIKGGIANVGNAVNAVNKNAQKLVNHCFLLFSNVQLNIKFSLCSYLLSRQNNYSQWY